MAEEKKSIFRQKSMDRISSPEELDHYLQVTTPGTWMSLGALIILLMGVCIWAVLGHLDTELSVAVMAEGGTAVCYVPDGKMKELPDGAQVTIGAASYELEDCGLAAVPVDGKTELPVRMAGGLNLGDLICPLKVRDADLPDGVYEGTIILETVSPISFIFN